MTMDQQAIELMSKVNPHSSDKTAFKKARLFILRNGGKLSGDTIKSAKWIGLIGAYKN